MISMHRYLLLIVLSVSIGLAASCTHVPRSPNNSQDTASIRAQYLDNNPHGLYNSQIRNNELAKGMNVIEVLASWGIPDERQWTPSSMKESWTYYARNPYNEDYIVYELVFEDRTLTRWIMDRITAAAGTAGLEVPDHVRYRGTDPTVPRLDAFGGSTSGSKK